MVTRRQFNKGLVSLALSGLAVNLHAETNVSFTHPKLGKLIPDPKKALDLPEGFSYRVISSLGDFMDDKLTVPDRADGMGCIALDEERVVLVRNHELSPKHNKNWLVNFTEEQKSKAYDSDNLGVPLSGGTSNIVYNLKTGKVEQQYMSLLGTIRNCAGGTTPWGSWLTCEESVLKPIDSDAQTDSNLEQKKPKVEIQQEHGYVFEVPATANGLVDPKPIKEMGRFNHEAACVDPTTGYVYLTEDRDDSLLYRFIPMQKQNLHAGGKLQALMVKGQAQFDTRNWQQKQMHLNTEYQVQWVDLDDVTSPKDDLRLRGFKQGAALFARGEGICLADDGIYFCCTSGGAKKLGQIMRLSETGGKETLSLFLESQHPASFNFGDNICVAPHDHLVVCEDQYSDQVNNYLKVISPQGKAYDLGKVRWQTEPAGACFSPDGKTLFVNLYSPTMTLAITGPWEKLAV